MANIQKENLEKLLNKQRSLKIIVGSIGGVILLLFFFSFPALVDHGFSKFYIVETVLTIIIFFSFFLLNRISFAWIKLTRSRKAEYKDIIPKLKHNDVDKELDQVFQRINS